MSKRSKTKTSELATEPSLGSKIASQETTPRSGSPLVMPEKEPDGSESSKPEHPSNSSRKGKSSDHDGQIKRTKSDKTGDITTTKVESGELKRELEELRSSTAAEVAALREAHEEEKKEMQRTLMADSMALKEIKEKCERFALKEEGLLREVDQVLRQLAQVRSEKQASELEALKWKSAHNSHAAEVKELRSMNKKMEKQMEQSAAELKSLRDAVRNPAPCEYCALTRAEGDRFRKQNKALRDIIAQMEEEERKGLPYSERVRPLNKGNTLLKQQVVDLTQKLSVCLDKEKEWSREKSSLEQSIKHLSTQLTRMSVHEHRVMELEVQNQLLLTMVQNSGKNPRSLSRLTSEIPSSVARAAPVGGTVTPMRSLITKAPRILPPLIESKMLDQDPPPKAKRTTSSTQATETNARRASSQATAPESSLGSSLSSRKASEVKSHSSATRDALGKRDSQRQSIPHSRESSQVSRPTSSKSDASSSSSVDPQTTQVNEVPQPVRSTSSSRSSSSSSHASESRSRKSSAESSSRPLHESEVMDRSRDHSPAAARADGPAAGREDLHKQDSGPKSISDHAVATETDGVTTSESVIHGEIDITEIDGGQQQSATDPPKFEQEEGDDLANSEKENIMETNDKRGLDTVEVAPPAAANEPSWLDDD